MAISILGSRISFIVALMLSVAPATGCAQLEPGQPSRPRKVASFDECVAEGGKILKSYPAQCVSADGSRFFDEAVRQKPAAGCKNVCGNGVCEEVVCFMLGCPCAESTESCPQDCRG